MPSNVFSRDGTLLHTEESGAAAGPTVIFSHCWSSSLAIWKPVVERLAPSLRVVLYDQRGHGASQAPISSSSYSIDKLADDLCAILQAKVPEGQKALLVGHSMGGIAIMAAASRNIFKEKVERILLTNTGSSQLLTRSTAVPVPGALGTWISRAFMSAKLPMGGPDNKLFLFILKRFVLGRRADYNVISSCAQLLRACAPRVRGEWGRALSRAVSLDDSVKQIAVPTLVLAGGDDRITPPWHARHIAGLIPNHNAQVAEIPGLGHMAPLEIPDILAQQVNQLAEAHQSAAQERAG